ncbi:hypothetical protein J437_LFUL016224 [Ladona fulva]|uniref:Uncharacterized protein n=1 Tax=Ladona fulva TaxID=123851 RepID=A0A8K0PA03_LADFU|nr:hypothetical protein J437_LFUL016224 [Ladona fulva]
MGENSGMLDLCEAGDGAFGPCGSECVVGHLWYAELALWDEPNDGLRRPNRRSWETMKGVGCLRQHDGGHGSCNPLRSV